MNNKIKSLVLASVLVGSQSIQVFAFEENGESFNEDTMGEVVQEAVKDLEFFFNEAPYEDEENIYMPIYVNNPNPFYLETNVRELYINDTLIDVMGNGSFVSEGDTTTRNVMYVSKETGIKLDDISTIKVYFESVNERHVINSMAETTLVSIQPIEHECICGDTHDSLSFICEECTDTAFGCEEAFNNHIDIKHTPDQETGSEAAPNDEEDLTDEEEETCPHCGEPTHTIFEFSCTCGDDFGCEETLNIHMDETGHEDEVENEEPIEDEEQDEEEIEDEDEIPFVEPMISFHDAWEDEECIYLPFTMGNEDLMNVKYEIIINDLYINGKNNPASILGDTMFNLRDGETFDGVIELPKNINEDITFDNIKNIKMFYAVYYIIEEMPNFIDDLEFKTDIFLDFNCEQCEDKFETRTELNKHIEDMHTEEKEEEEKEEETENTTTSTYNPSTYTPNTTYKPSTYKPSTTTSTYKPSTTYKSNGTELVKTGDGGLIAYALTGLSALGGVITSIFKKR